MADDVSTRFGVDGIQGVLDALKQLREEAKKTGEEGGSAFEAMKEGISEVGKELLAFVAVGAVIEKTKELFSEVVTGAVSLSKLQQATGMSVERLQALGQVSEEVGVSSETMNRGLELFTRNIGMAEQGSKKAGDAFAHLGISVKELQQLSPDQQFDLVAQKLESVENASQRAAIGSQIFGRSFLEMEPALKQVADEGLGGVIANMQRLGVLMDQDTINEMVAAKKSMHDVNDELKGLATQFLTGLMPAVSEAMDDFVKETSSESGAVGAMKILGQVVGAVVRTIELAFMQAGQTIGNFAALAMNHVHAMGEAFDALKSGSFSKLGDIAKQGFENDKDIVNRQVQQTAANRKAFEDAWAQVGEAQKPAATPEAKHQPIIPGVDSNDAAVAKARLAFLQAQLEAENAVFMAQAHLQLATEKSQYDAGKLSLQQYFDDRKAILEKQFANEAAILKARRAAVAAEPIATNDNGTGAYQKKAELAKLDGEIAAKQIEQQTALADLQTQRTQEELRNKEQQISAEQKLLTIEGQKADAARLGLQIETQKLALELQHSGASQAEVAKAVNDYKTQAGNRIDFEDTKQNASDALNEMDQQIAAIKAKVNDGSLFPAQAEQQIINLEKQRLPQLQQLAQQMVDLANKTKTPGNPLGDQGMIAQAEQFAQKVGAIQLATDQLSQQMGKLKQAAQDSFQNGFASAINSIISGTNTVAGAFRKMAFDIASQLVQIETKFLANQFFQWLTGTGQNSGTGGINAASKSTSGILGSIGSWIGGLFGGGSGGAAGSAASAATTTANTTAITANTAAQAAATTAHGALIAALTANTAAVTASAASSTTSGAGSWLSSLGSAFSSSGHKHGGQISGPGTGTSDSIPAMLSDGEFVVNATAVNKPGVLALLHAINGTPGYARGYGPSVQRYAEGGAVSSSGGAQISHYHVDASQVPAHIIQQAIDNVVAGSIARQPVRIRSSLG